MYQDLWGSKPAALLSKLKHGLLLLNLFSVACAQQPFKPQPVSPGPLLVKFQPKYPKFAHDNAIQGACTIEYSVTKTGQTAGHRVLDCSESIFIDSSVHAVKKFLYQPKWVAGKPTVVHGVNHTFTFNLSAMP